MSGQERANLYQLAVETGLRASELRSLIWSSFTLEPDSQSVSVLAAYSKNRRDDVLPLRASTAKMLAAWYEEQGRPAGLSPAFNMPKAYHLSKVIRADLADARQDWLDEVKNNIREREQREISPFLRYRDESGKVLDFHALRHTIITNLARSGVHPKVAQQLARHSTITLTMDRYSHTVMGELAEALDRLPDLGNEVPARQPATGTDGTSLPISLPKSLPIQAASNGGVDRPAVPHELLRE